ncbi:MAG: ribosome maturation factor RimP [Culicoidibacterales bacterium]
MKLDAIEPLIKEAVESKGYTLFELNWTRFEGNDVLQVLIDAEHEIQIDDCVIVNDIVSPLLDTLSIESDNYLLEVASPGLERPIRTSDEMKEAVGAFIFIKFKQDKEKLSLEGTLESFEDEVATLSYNLKGRMKQIQVAYSEIKFARYAVKF